MAKSQSVADKSGKSDPEKPTRARKTAREADNGWAGCWLQRADDVRLEGLGSRLSLASALRCGDLVG